jgi:RHS repeat-associated protein
LASVSEYLNGNTLPTGTQEYDYDRWGNRTIKDTSSAIFNKTQFTVNTANNRLGVPSGQPGVMEYDAAGNLTNDTYTGAGSRTYDAENKMTSAWGGNNQAQTYQYDGAGQRIKRTVNGDETWQVYGFGGELLAEYPVNGDTLNPVKEYGYRNGQLLVTSALDTVWSDDAVPTGAAIAGDSESWNWVSSSPSSFSGSTAHQSNIVAGLHQHYFYGATATLSVNTGDKLVAYVYLDPSNMPSEIMLQWAEGGTWDHRAYWGANNLPWGVDGTNSRRYMGPLPASGSWVRLEVPVNLVGLEGKMLHGMAFSMWGGRATWDRAGKTSAATTSAMETVWSQDAVPTGAAIAGDSESWNWVNSNPGPFSGNAAHQSNIVAGVHQHYFYGATATLSVNTGDKLVAYVYIDPGNLPSEIMLQFNDGTWDHRAYWGANNLPWGVDGTYSRRYMGPLPAAGSWVRLEVPASLVGLEGHTLNGTAFSMWGGRATWDRAGKTSSAGVGSAHQWLVSDHLGTPRMIIDQTGTLANVKRHDYLPFGEELSAGVGGRTTSLGYESGDGVRQQFTQKERDIETGLDYFGARYLSSTQGRFTSADPLLSSGKSLQPQSWNRYSYCLNDPLTYVDRKGLIWGKKKTSDTNTEYVWFEGKEVGEGYDVVTEFYVEGVIDGRSVSLSLNPDGPRALWKQLLLNADPSLSLMTDNSDYFVKGYQVGETRAQWAERSRAGAVDMMPNQAFDVGLFAAGGGLGRLNRVGAGSAVEGTTTLYRAVGEAEFEQVMRTGTFQAGPNSLGGKWFAESAEHAAQWGQLLEGKGAFKIIDAKIPTVQAEKFMRLESLDGIGPARYAELDQLKNAVVGKGP